MPYQEQRREITVITKLEELLEEIGQDLDDFTSFYYDEVINGDDASLQVEIETFRSEVQRRCYRDGHIEEYYDDEVWVRGGEVYCVHTYDSEEFKEYVLRYEDENYMSIVERVEPFAFYEVHCYTVNTDGGLSKDGIYLSTDADDVKAILISNIECLGANLEDDLDSVEVNVWTSSANDDLMSIYEDVKAQAMKYQKE